MLKVAVAASAACTDTTANMLLNRIDQIGGILSQIAKVEYNPPPVERGVVDNISQEAITAAYLERPFLPAPSPIASTLPANGTVVSQPSPSATLSQNANASITKQEVALLLEQKSTMSETISSKRGAEETVDDVTPLVLAAPTDPPWNTE